MTEEKEKRRRVSLLLE